MTCVQKHLGDGVVDQLATRNDREYFQARAMQEFERAQAAGHPAAVRSHYDMATHYLGRASAEGRLLG